MTLDPIVQEVREARAAIAAEFGYDLSQYLVWIREQTQIRRKSLNKTGLNKLLATTGQASQLTATVTRKWYYAPPGPTLERLFSTRSVSYSLSCFTP